MITRLEITPDKTVQLITRARCGEITTTRKVPAITPDITLTPARACLHVLPAPQSSLSALSTVDSDLLHKTFVIDVVTEERAASRRG